MYRLTTANQHTVAARCSSGTKVLRALFDRLNACSEHILKLMRNAEEQL